MPGCTLAGSRSECCQLPGGYRHRFSSSRHCSAVQRNGVCSLPSCRARLLLKTTLFLPKSVCIHPCTLAGRSRGQCLAGAPGSGHRVPTAAGDGAGPAGALGAYGAAHAGPGSPVPTPRCWGSRPHVGQPQSPAVPEAGDRSPRSPCSRDRVRAARAAVPGRRRKVLPSSRDGQPGAVA